MAPNTNIAETDSSVGRPFYFIVALWGERFHNYFLNLSLPMLLAPGNLPSLATRQRSKFFICTRPEDWKAITAAPIFKLLERYADPVYLEIPPCPQGAAPCVHMGIGHRLGCQMAYEAKAYPFVFQPDTMFSDGLLVRLQQLARDGVELALVPALRFAEEPLFDRLRHAGIVPRERNGIAEPISLTSRQLVSMALGSMHSETLAYEWDAPYFTATPSAVWWQVPEENGIIVHSMSWAPLLFDFTAVPAHDTSTFDNWTIDGDYVYKNLGNIKRIHIVCDSDEMFIGGWSPAAYNPLDLTPHRSFRWNNILKKVQFRNWFYSGVFDPLKQQIFFESIRWHADPINERWDAVEKHALRTLLLCVTPPPKAEAGLQQLKWKSSKLALSFLSVGAQEIGRAPLLPQQKMIEALDLLVRVIFISRMLWIYRKNSIARLAKALRGDKFARKRARWRIKQIAYQLRGRHFDKLPPTSDEGLGLGEN